MKPAKIPVTREGVPFIGTLVFWSVIFALMDMRIMTMASGLLFCFCLYFFRDPERIIPKGDGLITAPADGKIIRLEEVGRSPHISGPMMKISIFMNVFNCHVNRSPIDGTVSDIVYKKGSFWPADHKKSFEKNEHNCILIKGADGPLIEVVQVAGLIARRIVCWAEVGDNLKRGKRLGMIRFGSRVDVYLPLDAHIVVSIGDKTYAGETVLARIEMTNKETNKD